MAAVAFAASAHAPPFGYVASSGDGTVFQYGLDPGGSFSPLVPPSVAAGESPTRSR